MGTALNSLRQQAFAAVMAAALPFIFFMALVGLRMHASQLVEHTEQNLIAQAGILAIHPVFLSPGHDGLEAAAQEWAARGGFRVTIIDETGAVLAETGRLVVGMVPHHQRPEVVEALANGSAAARRFSTTLQDEWLYAAARFETAQGPRGVVRLALPASALRAQAGPFRRQFVLAALVCMGLVGLVGYACSRVVARPIQDAVSASADLSLAAPMPRLPRFRQEEADRLSARIHRLSEALQDQLRLTREQTAESAAILSGMVEGVLAVDPRQRVLKINAAACGLLGVSEADCEGHSMQECLRHGELLAFAREVLAVAAPIRKDIPINAGKDLLLEVSGTPSRNETGEVTGAVLVMNDVTRLRRLQRVRSEFVANVSHELKTPITAILGFAETLRDGAMDRPEEATKFLEIIERQAQRMYEMVDDLLQLSRIEDDMARGEIRREETLLHPVVDAAVQQIFARNVGESREIRVDCPEWIAGRVNAPLLEQALVNLLDNALKYSDSTQPVELAVAEVEQAVRIDVRDFGEGIAQPHLPRVFERFYRVDKARGRQVGGTGLGLSIVKHVAQAHGGSVSAQSRLGEGSTFTLMIPRP